jgi:hypothetical protein
LIGSLCVEQCIILDSFKLKMEVLVDQCTRQQVKKCNAMCIVSVF